MPKKIMPGVNDLATLHPDIADQWHPTHNGDLTARQVSPGSKSIVSWRCAAGHCWEASITNRVSKRSGCPYCSGRRAIRGINDLATVNPTLAQEWHLHKNSETPIDVTVSSGKKVWWHCSLGHEWEATVANRNQGTGCPVCAGKSVLPGFNDLQTLYPSVANEWDFTKNTLTPTQVLGKSRFKAWWLCGKGHSWQSAVHSRTAAENGCPYCAGQRAITGLTDALTHAPHLNDQWHPSKNAATSLSEMTTFSNQKVWWVCEQGHEWECRVADRSRSDKPTSCPTCNAHVLFSRAEREIAQMLRDLGMNVQTNVRSILGGNRELDIYLPDAHFAIEFNGLYWHTEEAGKDANYHVSKYQACANKGITLYQVWEDDWRLRQSIVIRGILHRLRLTHRLQEALQECKPYYAETIGARQTAIEEIDYAQAAAFLDENHIQGSALGTHYLGLQDSKKRLRAVLVLTKSPVEGELVISRYASAGIVSGGFTKLLNHAQKTYAPKRWVTFADRSISDGALYQSTGFVADRVLPPDYMYVVNKQRVHKFNYRLKRFRSDPELAYEEGMSERELAILNKIPRIWDSGKIRFIKDVTP